MASSKEVILNSKEQEEQDEIHKGKPPFKLISEDTIYEIVKFLSPKDQLSFYKTDKQNSKLADEWIKSPQNSIHAIVAKKMIGNPSIDPKIKDILKHPIIIGALNKGTLSIPQIVARQNELRSTIACLSKDEVDLFPPEVFLTTAFRYNQNFHSLIDLLKSKQYSFKELKGVKLDGNSLYRLASSELSLKTICDPKFYSYLCFIAEGLLTKSTKEKYELGIPIHLKSLDSMVCYLMKLEFLEGFLDLLRERDHDNPYTVEQMKKIHKKKNEKLKMNFMQAIAHLSISFRDGRMSDEVLDFILVLPEKDIQALMVHTIMQSQILFDIKFLRDFMVLPPISRNAYMHGIPLQTLKQCKFIFQVEALMGGLNEETVLDPSFQPEDYDYFRRHGCLPLQPQNQNKAMIFSQVEKRERDDGSKNNTLICLNEVIDSLENKKKKTQPC